MNPHLELVQGPYDLGLCLWLPIYSPIHQIISFSYITIILLVARAMYYGYFFKPYNRV